MHRNASTSKENAFQNLFICDFHSYKLLLTLFELHVIYGEMAYLIKLEELFEK